MIQTFKIQAEYNDLMFVVINIDTDKFTVERATKINNAWSNGPDRIEYDEGNVIHAAVRLHGCHAMRAMMLVGGACFKSNNAQAVSRWKKELSPMIASNQHELLCDLGITVVEAQVEIPVFDTVELVEIAESHA